jgi:hypothetical protein
MHDVKNFEDIKENEDCNRCDCIGDRTYFKQIQYESMFEFKTVHVPMENIIK